VAAAVPVPDALHPRRLARRLLEVAAFGLALGALVVLGPGFGDVRRRLAHASPGWVVAAAGLEVLSALSYVVIFRAVFCARMNWRLSYQIGMSEQAANSVLSVSGAGGLALGVWALRRVGMSIEHIGRRTVAFFLLTSLANVAGVIVFAAFSVMGVIDDPDPALTYAFGVAAATAVALVLALGRVLRRRMVAATGMRTRGRLERGIGHARDATGQGVADAVLLLRRRPAGVIGGSLGTTAFDICVLAACFAAFGHEPTVSVVVLGYLIGQLGGNIPTPGGIGGVEFGLIGAFVLYHEPLATTTAAVLVYHAIAIWVPALLGAPAFVQLRRTLSRDVQPAEAWVPLAAPIDRAAA
jgi:uncharacterized membrane protein YbhN (UPF0104 family)